MFKNIVFIIIFITIAISYISGCLITNCPKGGKRSNRINNGGVSVKQCTSCGPGKSGQCFGANICCGPFGCLFGTRETFKCQREGYFYETEPCIAGNSFCRNYKGRCAADGICCTQESCYNDSTCSFDELPRMRDSGQLDLNNLLKYPYLAEYE